ncbi:restriction endonuclease subunit S [Bradyrhizobium sp. HKCCYLS2033]|uniref:restriction endonuclease subunit S n=1 Tax=unclassified Bradyrhizobium TaxID=2631580 RepID=UPI003EBD3430
MSIKELAIAEFCDTGSGGTPDRSKTQYYGGSIPWVKSGELRESEIIDTEEKITELGLRESSAKLVPRGSILLAMYGATVGRMAFLGVDAATNQAVCNIRPDPKFADARYVFYGLQSKMGHFLSRAAGGAQPNISQAIVRETKLRLPPLDEQRRIAAILDKADAMRRKRRRAIELLDSLVQSIFSHMFGDLVASNVWPRGTISNWVADFDTGKNLAPDSDSRNTDGYRVLKVSAVTSGVFLPAESKPLPRNYEPPVEHLVRKGDLLFSRANTAELIGATAYVEAEIARMAMPDKIWRFVWNRTNRPNPHFIHALFSSSHFRRELTKRATGTSGSMKNISKEKVLKIEVAMPDRSKQDEFTDRSMAVRRAALLARRQLELMEQQFSALQHRAFGGNL